MRTCACRCLPPPPPRRRPASRQTEQTTITTSSNSSTTGVGPHHPRPLRAVTALLQPPRPQPPLLPLLLLGESPYLLPRSRRSRETPTAFTTCTTPGRRRRAARAAPTLPCTRRPRRRGPQTWRRLSRKGRRQSSLPDTTCRRVQHLEEEDRRGRRTTGLPPGTENR